MTCTPTYRPAPSRRHDDASQRLEEWLRAVAQGDPQALRAVIRATGERLTAEAQRMLHAAECAEEAVQDTWLRVWHAAASFDPQVSRPMTWLLRIVQHRAIDMRRAQRRRRETFVGFDDALAESLPDETPGPEARVAKRQRDAELERRLTRLSREQRLALQLVLTRGCSPPEIAARCRVADSTARSWLQRGLARVRSGIEPGPVL